MRKHLGPIKKATHNLVFCLPSIYTAFHADLYSYLGLYIRLNWLTHYYDCASVYCKAYFSYG